MAKNFKKRIIYDDLDYGYDEYVEDMKQYMGEEEFEEQTTYEAYKDYLNICADDSRTNLNINLSDDLVVVAFANLGLWNGHHNGIRVLRSNVNSIFMVNEDFNQYYCDRYNVRATCVHHDGTNSILYRVAPRSKVDELSDKVVFGDMDEKGFMRATKSLRPYVANVFGW